MGTVFNSNPEAERASSVQTDIHRNPKGNLMIQETFESHMQIHYGVEGHQSREVCPRCIQHKASQTRQPHHCHCSVAEMSDAMREDSKNAWKVEKNRQQLVKITPSEESVA